MIWFSSNPPAMDRTPASKPDCSEPHPAWPRTLTGCSHGVATASLGNPFQHLTSLTGKIFFMTSYLNVLSASTTSLCTSACKCSFEPLKQNIGVTVYRLCMEHHKQLQKAWSIFAHTAEITYATFPLTQWQTMKSSYFFLSYKAQPFLKMFFCGAG